MLLFFFHTSCVENTVASIGSNLNVKNNPIKEGCWLGKLIIDSNNFIPINFSVINEKMIFTNDSEKIHTSFKQLDSNSYQVNMPVFNSTFIFSLINDSMKGYWFNYAKGDDYKMPFHAVFLGDDSYRFKVSKSEPYNFTGKWEVTFASSDSSEFEAIGVFNQKKSALSGSFITETGDYRFLEGVVKNDSLFLSCFDGAHAFLFKAVQKNNKINGLFFSGKHYKESWQAIKNENFILKNPDSITSIASNNNITFSFPDLDSVMVGYPSEKYNGKVVVIQIIGSWCPNCMDETMFITKIHEKYHQAGLEVICLAYEKPSLFKDKCKNLKRLIDHSGAKYKFLVAGSSSKKEVERTLPFIENITAFPTSIYIDKKGCVRKIHSGFYGPGTGDYYKKYTAEIEELIKSLLAENLNL